MTIAPMLPAEDARLAELKSLGILDTLPESAYEDVTYLASLICQVPISAISFVDRDRQWFKSLVGLEAAETPHDLTFCAHAILKNELFVVNNALEDPRFADNPLVTDGPKIRFYAGAPLQMSSGHRLGTLCVIDTQPRTLSPTQSRALTALANQVVRLLESKRLSEHPILDDSRIEVGKLVLEHQPFSLDTPSAPIQQTALSESAQPTIKPTAPQHPLRILVADDNEVNRKLATRFLQTQGYFADTANDGRETLQAIKLKDYDLVLMDLQMPNMSGIEATREIRQLIPVARQPKIIAFTADAMKSQGERCIQAGMDGYVNKPLLLPALMAEIERCCAPKASFQDLINRRFLGDRTLFCEIARTFLDSRANIQTQLESAIQLQNSSKIDEAAHKLKGAVSLFDRPLLVSLLEQLECTSRVGVTRPGAAKIGQIFAELDKLCHLLKTHVESSPCSPQVA